MNCPNLLYRIVVIPLVICTLLGCGETEDTSSFALSETVVEGDTASFSGRVVNETGNPVAGLALVIQPRTIDDNTGGIQGSVQTDAQGYFVQYVDRNKATRYRVSVEYKGLCATSEMFVLRVGERREDLILKLPGVPQ